MFELWLEKHRKFKKIISIGVLFVFCFSLVSQGSYAAIGDATSPFKSIEISPKELKPLASDTFEIPSYMATVRDSFKGTSDRIVIHIQDAHCNYEAQKKISDITNYLNEYYGVKVANLEGGKGEYDLRVFTGIREGDIRAKVSDYFVQEGLVNGVEEFASNDPGKISLWGVEDSELYLDNLKVYRDSLTYKDEVQDILKSLQHIINNLKRHIYTSELLEFDMKYSGYKFGELSFREYFVYLAGKASEHGINLKQFSNIYLLKKAMEEEEGVDFKKANNQRDDLVDYLEKMLSKKSIEELVKKTLDYKTKLISDMDFYEYLVEQSKYAGVKLEDYPELQKYIVYISLYNAINKTQIMREIAVLEDKITESLYKNDKQRELGKLAKNLIITKNLFDLELVKEDYEYFLANKKDFAVQNYVSFINKEAPLFKITASIDENAPKLDGYRERMEKFFEFSFERDDAFMRNIRFAPGVQAGNESAILVTGGFHTDNILELLRKEGISYVSIIPNFTNKEGYESPYFKLLGGEEDPAIDVLRGLMSENALMQIASPLSELGGDVWGRSNIEAFEAEVYLQKEIAKGTQIQIELEGAALIRAGEMQGQGRLPAYMKVDKGMLIINPTGSSVRVMTLAGLVNEVGRDLLGKNIRASQVAQDVRSEAANKLRELAKKDTDAGKKAKINELADKVESGLAVNYFQMADENAGVKGMLDVDNAEVQINVDNQEDAANTLVHESLGLLVSDHKAIEGLEKMLGEGDYDGAANLLAAAGTRFYTGENGQVILLSELTPDKRNELIRDYRSADFLGMGGVITESFWKEIKEKYGENVISSLGNLRDEDLKYVTDNYQYIQNAHNNFANKLTRSEETITEALEAFVQAEKGLLESGIVQADLKLDNVNIDKAKAESQGIAQAGYTFDYDFLFLANNIPYAFVRYLIYSSIMQTSVMLRNRLGEVYGENITRVDNPIFEKYFDKYLSMLSEAGIGTEIIEASEEMYDQNGSLVTIPRSLLKNFINRCWINNSATNAYALVGSYQSNRGILHNDLMRAAFDRFVSEFLEALKAVRPGQDRDKTVNALYMRLKDKNLITERINRSAIDYLYEVVDSFHYDYRDQGLMEEHIKTALFEKLGRISFIGLENIKTGEALEKRIKQGIKKSPRTLTLRQANLFLENLRPMMMSDEIYLGRLAQGGINKVFRRKEFEAQVDKVRAALEDIKGGLPAGTPLTLKHFSEALQRSGLLARFRWTAENRGVTDEELLKMSPYERSALQINKMNQMASFFMEYINGNTEYVDLVNTILPENFVLKMPMLSEKQGVMYEFSGFENYGEKVYDTVTGQPLTRKEIDQISEEFKGQMLDVYLDADLYVGGQPIKVAQFRFDNGLEVSIPMEGGFNAVKTWTMWNRPMELMNSLPSQNELLDTFYINSMIQEKRGGQVFDKEVYIGSLQQDFGVSGDREVDNIIGGAKNDVKKLNEELQKELENNRGFQEKYLTERGSIGDSVVIEEIDTAFGGNIMLKAWVFDNAVLLSPMYKKTETIRDALSGASFDKVKWAPIGGMQVINMSDLNNEDLLERVVGGLQQNIDKNRAFGEADAGTLVANVVSKTKDVHDARYVYLTQKRAQDEQQAREADERDMAELFNVAPEPGVVENVEEQQIAEVKESVQGLLDSMEERRLPEERLATRVQDVAASGDKAQRRGETVRILTWINPDLPEAASIEGLGHRINSMLGKAGYGRRGDTQINLYQKIDGPKGFFEKAEDMVNDTAHRSKGGKDVFFVTEEIYDAVVDKYANNPDVIVWKISTSDKYTPIMEQYMAARHAAFCRMLENEGKDYTAALESLTDFLSRISDRDYSDVTDLNSILQIALSTSVFEELETYIKMEEETAVSL